MSDERLIPEPHVELGVAAERAGEPAPSEAAQLLQAQIAATRQRVASEVDAIAEKIKPENIKRQLVLAIKARAMVAWQLARRNPAPLAAVLGAGVLLMIWRGRSRHA